MHNTLNMSLKTQYFISQILFTLAKIQEVSEVENLVPIFKNKTLYLQKLIFFYKSWKTAKYAMVDRVILNYKNIKLRKANM